MTSKCTFFKQKGVSNEKKDILIRNVLLVLIFTILNII